MIYFRELLEKVMAIVGEDANPEEYLDFIRNMPCLVKDNECWEAIAPHHLKHRGAGGSDFLTIPLCGRHHTGGIHQMGIDTFAKKYGIDYEKTVLRLAKMYNQLNIDRVDSNGEVF